MSQNAEHIETSDSHWQLPQVYHAPAGEDVRILANKARELMPDDQVLIHIATDDQRLATLEDLFAFLAPDVEIIHLPAWDCLPYDRISPRPDIVAERVNALCGLLNWQKEKKRAPRILLTTVAAISQRVTPAKALDKAQFYIQKNDTLNIEELQDYLVQNGYNRTDTVREAGEYAVRGGIVDLYPSGQNNPIRIDLFGDDVESIKVFDSASQRSIKTISSLALLPASEFFLNKESIENFRQGFREYFGMAGTKDPIYEAISEGRKMNGCDHWLPLFYGGLMDSVFDYVPDSTVSFDHNAPIAWNERITQIDDFYQTRQTLLKASQDKKAKATASVGEAYHPLPAELLYLESQEREDIIAAHNPFELNPFGDPNDVEKIGARVGRNFADIRSQPEADIFGALALHIKDIRDEVKGPILIAGYSKGARDRIQSMMEAAEFSNLKKCDSVKDIKKLPQGAIGLIILPLEHGFIAPDLAICTERDILGDRLTRKAAARKRKADNFLTEVSSLEVGDLVVHVDHGIGRFVGLETLDIGGGKHDCLKLVYANDDKLFLPVEHIELLSRFGSDEGTMILDKLGGAGWQARKAKAKRNLMEIADHLLKTAAARELRKAEKLEVSNEVYNEFASTFPYHETDDQLKAIGDVLDDLSLERPMDRLICGDVGFGKTEIALRAAYVAAMCGMQVAIVAPTTLLVRQHYQNFMKRFHGTDLRIDQLSRLVTGKTAKSIKEGIADGSVNIVIGTHALFAKGLKFNNLGLLIVDEEQRFGVKQKERMKEIRENIHVLTLTATPIPRTLQMSLTGVKQMSIIATPPVDRLATRSFVLPTDPMVIREALLREHYRGGQSFYVVPRIKHLEEIENMLRDLVPEIRVITAHGQMPPTDLEDRMTAFYEGKYDLLLATNIIESGIDIPRANTMIVHHAEMFGLSQLYQIRGRIGRSKLRAYCYLTYPIGQKLTAHAQKRLEVLETLDSLGAGFQLASHDLDIRGAGNLLGDQQSGHIKEIGVELYQQMLEEAVAAARAGVDLSELEQMEDNWVPNINMGAAVLIPEDYVEDLSIRMSLYRRLADIGSEDDIENFAAELIDRFGDLPNEVDNLLDTVRLKLMCKAANIDRVDAGPKGAIIGFRNDSPPNVDSLFVWLQQRKGAVKLRPDQKLSAIKAWPNIEKRIHGLRVLLKEILNAVS